MKYIAHINFCSTFTTIKTLIVMAVFLQGCHSPKKLYLSEVEESLKKSIHISETYHENDFKAFPEPVQKYFQYIGLAGKEKICNAEIVWANSHIKLSPDKKWMKLKTWQFNNVSAPERYAYMKARIMGIIPFEGRDRSSNGSGHMFGTLARSIKIFDEKDPEIAHSALITLLAEALIVPGYAFEDYIRWEAIDSLNARAYISHQGIESSGIFHFNQLGEMTGFSSDDRYYTLPGGGYKKEKFSVTCRQYIESNGIKHPSEVAAIWLLDAGDYEYWKGSIAEVQFNIMYFKELKCR